MNIHRALSDIANIRAQLDRTETLRGFRSAAVSLSVVFLGLGFLLQSAQASVGLGQPLAVTEPGFVVRYLTIWLSVALASATTAGVEMIVRAIRGRDPSIWKLHRQLTLQILPGLLVGCVVTLAIAGHAIEHPSASLLWALPGLWSLIYALGLFNCLNRLPRFSVWVAVYFLLAGGVVLLWGYLAQHPAGWQMLLTFGVGQSGLATTLYLNLERPTLRGQEEPYHG